MDVLEYFFSNKRAIYVIGYLVTLVMVFSTVLFHIRDTTDTKVLRLIIFIFAAPAIAKYAVYLAISPWYDVIMKLKHKKLKEIIINYHPHVSVLIPARNEEVGIITTLKTILRNTYDNFEIVVINDGSTDNTDKVINDFVKNYNSIEKKNKQVQITYQNSPNGGKGRALNTGIKLATGEIIITIDADCVVDKNAIKNFVKYFADPNVMGAVANVKIGNPNTFWGIIQYLEFLFAFYYKKNDSILNTIYIVGGAGGAFRKSVFEKIGYYNHKNITEDIDMSIRLQEAGMRIVYASDAIINTEGASSAEGLAQQRLRWKRGRLQTFIEHRGLFFSVRRKHNKLLTWIILPLAVFGDIQLQFDLILLLLLYIYSYINRDFTAFITGLILVTFMFLVVMYFDDKSNSKLSMYLLAPIGWILLYVTTVIEVNALFKSLWGLYKKQEIHWQFWERTGITLASEEQYD